MTVIYPRRRMSDWGYWQRTHLQWTAESSASRSRLRNFCLRVARCIASGILVWALL